MERLKLQHLCFYLHTELKMVCKINEESEVIGELIGIDTEGFNGYNPLKVKYYGSCKTIPMYAAFDYKDVKPILSEGINRHYDHFGLIDKGLAIKEGS
ncbi:MAG: hypothetical protein S4CHLAM20_04560 [Chlamydiia bacterium]|nr:hypothetical protein [Chlamydiia bacterium]